MFLKYYHVEHLNLMVQQATQRIILLQAYVRGWLGAKRYRRILKEREQSALVLQSGTSSIYDLCSSHLSSHRFLMVAHLYSPAYRGHKVRKRVADDKSKAKFEAFITQFQAGENGFRLDLTQSEFLCFSPRFLSLSGSVCRGYLAKKKYKELVDEKNKAATKIQARYRGHKERKSFKRKQYETE